MALTDHDYDVWIPLCDDDGLTPYYLQGLEKYFKKNTRVAYAYSNVITFLADHENPFNVKEVCRFDFTYGTVPMQPSCVLDSSMIVFRKRVFAEDGIRYPSPQTKNLDAEIFKRVYNIYGLCPYTGLTGQYKALHDGQLGTRQLEYDYRQ